jgi:hypothetical protein
MIVKKGIKKDKLLSNVIYLRCNNMQYENFLRL